MLSSSPCALSYTLVRACVRACVCVYVFVRMFVCLEMLEAEIG